MDPLVSVVVPCYNAASFLPKLFKSLLMQDYRSIEIICVDDGSTDETRCIIESYSDAFKQKGYTFMHVSKGNGGVCSAINEGLKYVHGEYLVWSDSDDWYETDKVFSEVVEAFEKNPKCNCVRFVPQYVDEAGNKSSVPCDCLKKQDLFEDYICSSRNTWLSAGSHFVRLSVLFKYYPDKQIYDSKFVGQNIQLLAPTTYKSDVITLCGGGAKYSLFTRKDSMCRKRIPFSVKKKRLLESAKMICATVSIIYDMPKSEMHFYRIKVKRMYLKILCT